jgi:hypothetical protein
MVRRLRCWAVTALALAALCPALAAAASKPKVGVKILTDVGKVAPGKDDGFAQRCPKAFPHPVGTEFNGVNDHIGLDESFATGGRHRSWQTGVRNFGAASEIFFAGPVCLRARGRFAYPQTSGVVQAGATATVTVTCPSSARRALNGMLAPRTAADQGSVVMSRSVNAGTRRWVVGVRNLGTAPQSYLAGAVCTSAKLRVVRQFTDPISVPSGESDGARGVCPRRASHPIAAIFDPVDATGAGQFTVAAIAEDDPHELSVVVTNRSPTTERVVLGEICVG